MGDATMALNYNSNAFGTSVFMNGNVEFGTDDTSSILGSVTEPFPMLLVLLLLTIYLIELLLAGSRQIVKEQ